jgi:hypothetical protein
MLRGLRWTYCVFIAAASITAAASAQHGLHEGTNHPQADLIGVLRFIFYAAVAAYIVLASRTNQVANHGQG